MTKPERARSSRAEIKALRGSMNPALLRWTATRRFDARDALVVMGSPRSGTSWLAESLCALPRTALLFEPLHIARVPEAREAGLGWRTFRLPEDRWAKGEAFFDRVLSGDVLNEWTTSRIPVARAVTVRRWVVKFVRANQLVGWLTRRFPIAPPALVVRHPCAVVASQLSEGSWATVAAPPRNDRFLAAYPRFTSVLERLATREEFLAASWAIDTFSALALDRPYPFHLMWYERLIENRRDEIARLLDAWSVDEGSATVDAVVERLGLPSSTASRAVHDDPAARWRRTLTRDQIDRVLCVAHAFGLDFYGDDAKPDEGRLPRSTFG